MAEVLRFDPQGGQPGLIRYAAQNIYQNVNVGRAKGKAYLERLCDDLSDMLGLGDRNRMLVEAADAEFPTEQSVEASKAGSIKKAVDLSPREQSQLWALN